MQTLQEQQGYYDRVECAAEFIRNKIHTEFGADFQPLTAIVLGSGLGSVADAVESSGALILTSKEIPGWPQSTAPGHTGRVLIGKLDDRPVIVLQGRVHYYEGYSMRVVTLPARVMGVLGVKQFLATNAAGGVAEDLNAGDIAIVTDHINFMGDNPLVGPNEPRWNVRFPDMSFAYSPRLQKLLERAGAAVGVKLKHGVYAAFRGPNFETPAEVRMARTLGGDIVGMSTVPEVIVANSMGIEVAVLSCIANKAAGLSENPLTEKEVLDAMANSARSLSAMIHVFMRELNASDAVQKFK